jgi:hypothetical protein
VSDNVGAQSPVFLPQQSERRLLLQLPQVHDACVDHQSPGVGLVMGAVDNNAQSLKKDIDVGGIAAVKGGSDHAVHVGADFVLQCWYLVLLGSHIQFGMRYQAILLPPIVVPGAVGVG